MLSVNIFCLQTINVQCKNKNLIVDGYYSVAAIIARRTAGEQYEVIIIPFPSF